MANYLDFIKSDHDIVRDYVTAKDGEHYANLPADTVAIVVTHSNLPSKFMDLRFNLHTTIEGVKERFRKHFGTPVEYQRLLLKDGDKLICEMSDNNKKLGFFGVESGNVVHVMDEDPYSLSRGGGLTDTSLVEKYRMDDDKYNERKGTVREFIKEKKAKEAAERQKRREEGLEVAAPGEDSVAHIHGAGGLGSRCEVQPGARRGVIRWIGESEHLNPGYWVGVQFDEPVGRNNGSVRNTALNIDVSLFECGPGYGGFVRGKNVAAGPEYVEADPFADGEEPECQCGDGGNTSSTAVEEEEI